MFGVIFVNLGFILVSFWWRFFDLGGLLVTRSCPGPPKRSRGEKVTEIVVRGSSLESLNRHSVYTEWLFFKFVFFLCFFVMLLNWRSVLTESDFLTKRLVRGSSPAGPNFNIIQEKSRIYRCCGREQQTPICDLRDGGENLECRNVS